MKTLPGIAARLTRMIADENTTVLDFEKVIKYDPTLVMRLLRLVNSPFYGLRVKVKSISEAVSYLGIDNLRNLIVVDALKHLFSQDNHQNVFSQTRLWMHSVAVAICSQMIMERMFGTKGEDAFLCGILHDIGIIVESQVASQDLFKACSVYYSRCHGASQRDLTSHQDRGNRQDSDDVDLYIPQGEEHNITWYEKHFLGTDHTAIGDILISEWQLPQPVQSGIRQHHDIFKDVDIKSMPAVIQVSDYMASRLNFNILNGMEGRLSPPLIQHIRENLRDYKLLADDLPHEINRAEDLYSLDRR